MLLPEFVLSATTDKIQKLKQEQKQIDKKILNTNIPKGGIL